MNKEIEITMENGSLMTTSKVVADVFGKTHRDVTKAIKSLDCSHKFSLRNYSQSEYTTDRGKTYKCYNITEHGFYMLAMGFTGKKAAIWKESFLAEFSRLQKSEINADSRMNEISLEIDKVKDAGKAWSKLGLEVKRRKNIALKKKAELIDEIQLKLKY